MQREDIPVDVKDEDIELQPIPYDAIQFYVGYNKNRNSKTDLRLQGQ